MDAVRDAQVRCDRIIMALAEVGVDGVGHVWVDGETVWLHSWLAPPKVLWRAISLSHSSQGKWLACFACWYNSVSLTCQGAAPMLDCRQMTKGGPNETCEV